MFTKRYSEFSHWTDLHLGRPKLSIEMLLKFAGLALVMAVIADVPEWWGIGYFAAKSVTWILVAAAIFLPVRPATVLLLLLTVVGRDFDTDSTASIWNLNVGLIRPSWIVFGLVAVQLFKLRRAVHVPRYVRYSGVWFATVPVIAGLAYGGITGEHSVEQWIIDLKMPLMLLGAFVLVASVLRQHPSFVNQVLAGLIGALTARHLLDLIDFAAGAGPSLTETLNRVSEDSAKAGAVYFVFVGLILLSTRGARLWAGLGISVLAFLLIISYATRMIWVEFLITVPLIVILLDRKAVVRMLVSVVVVIVASGGLMYLVKPELGSAALGRFRDITEGRPESKFVVDVEYNLLSRIDPIRYAEILNITDQTKRRNSWLWGSGYGGYYNDEVINFPKDLASAYPQYSLDSGEFYRAHNIMVQMFHKYGLLGMVVFFSFWLIPGYALFRMLRSSRSDVLNNISLVDLSALAIAMFMWTAMLEMTWSGKGFLINGILVALVTSLATKQYSDAESSEIRTQSFASKWFS